VSQEQSTEQAKRASVHEQRMKRQQSGAKPNRAQVRAAQTRATQTAAAQAVAPKPAPDVEPEDTGVALGGGPSTRSVSRQRLTQAQRRAVERGSVARGTGMPTGVVTLTREQEMTMVREDLHRLLIIAGILLVGMIVLLFFID
jgi:hypothetical protein